MHRKGRGNNRPSDTTPMESAMRMTEFKAEETDPQGSYTGCPVDPNEKPVQDVDDL